MKDHLLHDLSHQLMRLHIKKDDIVIDATMGNGFDTLELAKLAKHVYAFDIQEQALNQTRKLLDGNHINNVTLIHDSHENILNYVTDFKYVVFNLGYLPKGNKEITTKTDITLKTIKELTLMMATHLKIQIMVYPGHPEGLNESNAIDSYLKSLDSAEFKVLRIDLPYQKNNPPYILLISKNK